MQNVPNYAWEPHRTTYLHYTRSDGIIFGVDTLEEAKNLADDYVYSEIDNRLEPQINDVIYLSIYSGLRHTMDTDIQALASSRIPSGNTQDKTLAFLIALIHEKHLEVLNLIQKIKDAIIYDGDEYKIRNHSIIRNEMEVWTKRADKIAELTTTARPKVSNFAAQPEFIRDWALVDLGEVVGFELTTTGNSVKLTSRINRVNLINDISANTTIKQESLIEVKLPPVGDRTNQTDGITVTARNGACRYNLKNSSGSFGNDVDILKDASRTFTVAELALGVKVRPYSYPKIFRSIDDQELNVGVVQTVSLDTTFGGPNIDVTVATSNSDIVTAVLTEHNADIAITGVGAGTATITVTATNPSGSVSTTFDVTVSAAPSGD